MFNHLIATLKDKKGQALSEYGLILALVAVIAIGALTVLGGSVNTTLGNVGGRPLGRRGRRQEESNEAKSRRVSSDRTRQ